jgi:hypothetical protein
MRSADRYSSNNDIDDIFNDVDNCDNHMERKNHMNDYSIKIPGGSSEQMINRKTPFSMSTNVQSNNTATKISKQNKLLYS